MLNTISSPPQPGRLTARTPTQTLSSSLVALFPGVLQSCQHGLFYTWGGIEKPSQEGVAWLTGREQISEAIRHMWGVRKSFSLMMRTAKAAKARSCRAWNTNWREGAKERGSEGGKEQGKGGRERVIRVKE